MTYVLIVFHTLYPYGWCSFSFSKFGFQFNLFRNLDHGSWFSLHLPGSSLKIFLLFKKRKKKKKIFLLFTPIHSFLPPSSALHCAEWLLIQFIIYFCFPKNNILKTLFLDLSRNRIAHDSINLLFIMNDHKSKYSYFPLHLILLWCEIAIRANYRYSVIYFYIT